MKAVYIRNLKLSFDIPDDVEITPDTIAGQLEKVNAILRLNLKNSQTQLYADKGGIKAEVIDLK